MTTIVCLTILVYCIMGKDIRSLLEKVKDVDWKGKGEELMEKIKPYAQTVGRTTARPLLQSSSIESKSPFFESSVSLLLLTWKTIPNSL